MTWLWAARDAVAIENCSHMKLITGKTRLFYFYSVNFQTVGMANRLESRLKLSILIWKWQESEDWFTNWFESSMVATAYKRSSNLMNDGERKSSLDYKYLQVKSITKCTILTERKLLYRLSNLWVAMRKFPWYWEKNCEKRRKWKFFRVGYGKLIPHHIFNRPLKGIRN